MGFKIKHYAQPVNVSGVASSEVILIELCVGLICVGMAFWARDLEIRLFIGCTVVAAICLSLTAYNICLIVKAKRQERLLKKELDETP
jgi:membrane protein DedA with SNARE-associated domain